MKKLSKIALASLLSVQLILVGCTANWISVALKDLPVVVQIITSVLSIVSVAQGKSMLDPATAAKIQEYGQKAKDGFTLAQNLYTSYKASGQPGLLGEIQSVLGAGQANLQAILALANIKDQATASAVTISLNLAITTVAAFEALMPSAPGIKKMGPTVAAQKPMSAGDLKKAVNAALQGNGYAEFALK